MYVFKNTKQLFSFIFLIGLLGSSFLFTSCEKDEEEKAKVENIVNDDDDKNDTTDKEDTTTDLKKNAIVSQDNDDFNIGVDQVSIDAVLSDDLINDVYDLTFRINESNHVPLIMVIGKLPTESTTFTQSPSKNRYDLKPNEFHMHYIRRVDNKYAYGFTDSIPNHKMNVVLNNDALTFNIAGIELSDASHFNFNPKKYNISFTIALVDIKKHEGISVPKTYDLVQ